MKSQIEYSERECEVCKEITSHVLVDIMVQGEIKHVWQCEICATFWVEEGD